MASKTPKTRKSAKAKAADPVLAKAQARYPHVKRVVATGKKGNPTRVEVECTAQYEGCEKTRECAMQDAFQVKRCHSCQRHYLKVRRRKEAKAA